MERKLLKAGVYGFILGILFSILYYPDTRFVQDVYGSYSTYDIPMREYIFKILRSSIKISFASMIVVAVLVFYRNLPKEEIGIKQFAWGVIKSFAIGVVLFLAIFYIIGMLT